MTDLAEPVVIANGVALHDYGVGTTDPVVNVGDEVNLTPQDTTGWTAAAWALLSKPAGSACAISASGMNATLSPAPDVAGEYVFELTGSGSNRRKSATAYLIACDVTPAHRLKLIPEGISLRDRDAFYRDRHAELAASVDGGGAGGTSGNATSIQGTDVSATAPTLRQVFVFDGSAWVPGQLTQDDILTGFWINSFARAGGLSVEVGAALATPAFTASYSTPPDSATLTDDQGTASKDVTSTPTSFASAATITKAVYGQTATFTLTAVSGLVTRTATQTVTWLRKAYWGTSSIAGPYDATFIAALTSSALASSRARTFSVTAGASEKIYYAFRSAYGAASFTVGGFSGGFSKVASAVSVTVNGVADTYDVWASDNAGLGATTVVVS